MGANELAANAFVTTHIATAAAGLTWALIEWQQHGAPTVLGATTGAVAGLVAITPACGFVNPMNAIFIGILVAVFCYLAVAVVKAKLGYDDALDAFGVHGVGGIWGPSQRDSSPRRPSTPPAQTDCSSAAVSSGRS